MSIGFEALWQIWLEERASPEESTSDAIDEHKSHFYEELRFVSFMKQIQVDRNYNDIIDSLSKCKGQKKFEKLTNKNSNVISWA